MLPLVASATLGLIVIGTILGVLQFHVGLAQAPQPPTTPQYEEIGQVTFTLDPAPVITAQQMGVQGIIGPDVVRLKDGRYRVFVQARVGEDVNILSAISSDGSMWAYEPGIRIRHGTKSEMDWEAGEPEAILGIDGRYYMAYTGRQPIEPKPSEGEPYYFKILSAVSDDGLNWSKLNASFSDPTAPNAFASSADIIIVDGIYVMYYTPGAAIGKATSNDAINWVRRDVVYRIGHDSATIRVNGTYYMFVKAPSALSYPPPPSPPIVSEDDPLFMAVSPDGVNWPNSFYRVVVKGGNGSDISNRNLGDPTAIVLSDGSLRVYFSTWLGVSIVSIRPQSSLPGLFPAKTSVYKVSVEGQEFDVAIRANSTVSDFRFSREEKAISFKLTGERGFYGSLQVVFLNNLLNGSMGLSINGIPSQFQLLRNATHTTIQADYRQGDLAVKITGTIVVPEFPLPMFVYTIAASIFLILLLLPRRTNPQRQTTIRQRARCL